MTSQFYVIGGEYSSFNFHKFKHGTEQVLGPYKTRKDAEEEWKRVSEENRPNASYRAIILEEEIK